MSSVDDPWRRLHIPEDVWVVDPHTGYGRTGTVAGYAEYGWYVVEMTGPGNEEMIANSDQIISAVTTDLDYARWLIQVYGGAEYLTEMADLEKYATTTWKAV